MGGYIGGNGGVTQVDGYSKTEVDSKVSDKVEDSQVLTDVPANAVFTDTTYSIQDGELSQNNFTDADHTKLDGIEASADVTDTANVVAALTAGTNITIAADGTITSTDTNTTYSIQDGELSQNNFTDADHTKLDGIETAATADQTKSDIEGLGIDVPATNLTGTIPAARLSTATTQAESDDSTKIATTAYVVDKITTLIGGAPSTLNDLNELAAAINDDANYNSTLTTALGTKLPKAGGTMTGDVLYNDNVKAKFGAGSDMSLFHNGNNAFLDNDTGTLFIQTDALSVKNATGTESVMLGTADGAVTLYHNNATKLATTSSGISVTGNIAVTGTVDGRDVSADGTKLDTIATNANYITNNNQLTNGAGYITSYTDTNTTYSAGSGLGLSGTTFSVDADLRGLVTQIGRDTNDYYLVGSTTHKWYLDGNEDMRLENDGDLHVDGNVVAYSTTTSDERLKKDIVKIDNALDKVSQLNGYTFEYKADGKKSAGVIAQEVEKVMPSAVSETTLPLKMGEDDKTEYKTVQYDQLHGLMIEAIKELKAEIEELKAR